MEANGKGPFDTRPTDRKLNVGPGAGQPSQQQAGLTPAHQPEQTARALRQEADRLTQIQVFATWQGQLPHPNDLERYDLIVPGTATQLVAQHLKERDELLALQRSQTEHREALEAMVTRSNVENSKRGQYFGLALMLAGMVVSGIFAIGGYPLEGLAGVLGSLGIPAAVFVYGNERRVEELMRKAREVMGQESPRS